MAGNPQKIFSQLQEEGKGNGGRESNYCPKNTLKNYQ